MTEQTLIIVKPDAVKRNLVEEGDVIAVIIERDNAVSLTREIIGNTNPKEASVGTIRGDFGISITENSIHASDSRESFDKEVNVVF